MEDNEPLHWAANTIYLAEHFLSKNKFRGVKRCLEDAEKILRDQTETLKAKEPSNGLFDSLYCEFYHQRSAEVAATWVKYGLRMFEISKENSLKHNKSTGNLTILPLKNSSNTHSSSPLKLDATDDEPNFAFKNVTQSDLKNLKQRKKKNNKLESIPEEKQEFHLFNHKVVLDESRNHDEKYLKRNLFEYDDDNYEKIDENSLVQDSEQARALFNSIHYWLKRVKKFYDLRSSPMEHINACMDLNELYKYLAFYEEDIECQTAVHKSRLNALETLSTDLHEVRPDWSRAVSAEILQELAKVQLELLELNLRRICEIQSSESKESFSSTNKIEALSDLYLKLKK